jgi:hypothetical protein
MQIANLSLVGLQSRDLAVKFWFAMRFFLEETESLWLFRGTDDTVINFPELGSVLANIEAHHNPSTDFVFLGNCVPANHTHAYPQGGSGYLLSRKAVEMLVPIEKEFIMDLPWVEDLAFTRVKKFTGSFDAMTSAAVCGHMFPPAQVSQVVVKNLSFPRCKRTIGTKWPCPYLVAPLRGLVFYHEYQGDHSHLFDNA